MVPFVLAQQYSLTHIAQEYLGLASRVDLAQLQFDSAFPNILPKFEKQLREAMGDKNFQEVVQGLQIRLHDSLAQQVLTKLL